MFIIGDTCLSSSFIDRVEEKLSRDIRIVDELLNVKDSVREEAIRILREITRLSGEAVRKLHIEDYEASYNNLVKAGELVDKIRVLMNNHPDLYYSGLVYNGLSEYVEALTTYMLLRNRDIPSYEELNVPYVPYLQGLGDTIGELRRHVLNLLDKGLVDEARNYIEVMERIYLWLRKLNYPDPLTPGLRHKIDVARRLIEDTKTLYISTKNSIELSRKLEETRNK